MPVGSYNVTAKLLLTNHCRYKLTSKANFRRKSKELRGRLDCSMVEQVVYSNQVTIVGMYQRIWVTK